MQRRDLLIAAAALAAPALGRAAETRVLKLVPQADLASLDPVWTTSYQTRDHALLVFDTLFGLDDAHAPQPQMAAGAETDPDGRRWTLTLREGLRFHDGAPVLARDCVASIRRWGVRDAYGQALLAATDELSAPDDRRIVFRLKYPFPLLPTALGKASPSVCAIMPARLAATDPYSQVTEMVGSGPYRFRPDERVSGSRVVYERFAGYVPRPDGTPQGTAGPKVAHFDRIEWRMIPDAGTVAAALQAGEVDWWLTPDPDLVALLRADRALRVETPDPVGFIATMRMNHLQPPFDNPAIRRALLGAVAQSEYMAAGWGADPSMWRDRVGVFTPGTPMATDAGMEVLTGPRDLDQVKRDLAAAGYKGEKVVLLGASDIATVKALAEVSAELFRRIGLNLDYQVSDWSTLVQRRTKTDPVDRGGWSVYQTSWSGMDLINPVGHVFLRGNGRAAAPGWPSSPRIEALREDWLKAPDLAAQQGLARRIQVQAFQDVPFIPLGQWFTPTAYRADLTGVLKGSPVFWNVRRT